ncbi:hypothetical protein F5890DRAFT_438692 [Lentinula detonsa]|uniref:Uncharacterized protein n=1 Tax=Lentinula detonsa TaxID=2804962 RepID=A0AA38PUJ4_9AGAR|nr:hypothetical protein F5890DRAFT_438692 [Lentinula detonsa]
MHGILRWKILSDILADLAIDSPDLSLKLSNGPALETQLLQEIESRLSSISAFLGESELSSSCSSAIDLITHINQLHTTLQTELLDAISTIPPSLHNKHKAHNALSAAIIEASLVKLSLMKAQLHQQIYGFSSDTQPEATMTNALSIAYHKLKDEAEDLMEAERDLDGRIDEYERLMQLVEGYSREGFGQIVEDYIRVEKETEECRRDLRRLGWTGFD